MHMLFRMQFHMQFHMEVRIMTLDNVSVGAGKVSTDYSSYTNTAKAAADTASKASDKAVEQSAEETGVVYEKSSPETSSASHIYNADLVNKLKADADSQVENLRNIVRSMMLGQSTSFAKANDDDIWKTFASGNVTVDAAAKAQAQEDISENGYWGVKQTSDRILDFAKALAGDDVKYAEQLRSAFEKGFKEATKAWGQDLPSISKDTYDAVQKKFDEWVNSSKQDKEENAATTVETV